MSRLICLDFVLADAQRDFHALDFKSFLALEKTCVLGASPLDILSPQFWPWFVFADVDLLAYEVFIFG